MEEEGIAGAKSCRVHTGGTARRLGQEGRGQGERCRDQKVDRVSWIGDLEHLGFCLHDRQPWQGF